uniref:CHAT domain-containing protein n=1 Tax=Saccharopolyspora galaxeae TaxID=2781241 RepID=UPI001F42A5F1|nr:CHAT domain-containing protein [Saccharopolyspora sp. HNM0986]
MSAGTAVAPARISESSVLWWRDRVGVDPAGALRVAEEVLATAGDPQLRVLARHVACLVAVEQGRSSDARQHARLALAAALRARLWDRAAQVRLTYAWTELDRGDPDAAWQHLLTAEPHLSGGDLARATCLRGLLRCQEDRYDEAVRDLSAALPRLTGHNDHQWAANALVGRGLAHLYRNRLDEAESDLAAAERTFRTHGRVNRAALCRHNRGCVALRAGDLPRALQLFDQARVRGVDPDQCPEVLVDRAEALAGAGMHEPARAELLRAADRLERLGRAVRLAETRLALAGCALRAGEPLEAINAAQQAARLFRSQRRPAWTALAVATRWQARLRAGEATRRDLASARRAGSACAAHGWSTAAAELWLTAARVAAGRGHRTTARHLLELAATVRGAAPGDARQLALGRLAEALLAEDAGDTVRLFDSCREGLRAVETHAAGIAALELRIEAFGLAEELGATAVRAALRTGDPRTALRWTERGRVSALHRRALRPPSDPELRTALVRLRSAVAGMWGAKDARLRHAMSEISTLERHVRDRALLVEGGAGESAGAFGIDEVVTAIGDAVLLTLFAHDGELHAVSVVDGRIQLHSLGSEDGAVAEAQRLRHALGRAAESGDERQHAAFLSSAQVTADALQQRLLGPLVDSLSGGRSLLVVPTGRLHAVPWSALPACRGRSVTVAPSLRCWMRGRADGRSESDGESVWVAGPGLEHAEREVRALHRAGGGRLLTGADAGAEQVLSAVDGAGAAHIAAHGWFRADQPLLSCLDLADGPLYGYDLDRLRSGPRTVVLSACEAGRSVVGRADQLTGLAATLLGRGTVTVIASVVPIPDERTVHVMVALHDSLRRGVAPAEALASAQARHGETGFLCLGYGGRS